MKYLEFFCVSAQKFEIISSLAPELWFEEPAVVSRGVTYDRLQCEPTALVGRAQHSAGPARHTGTVAMEPGRYPLRTQKGDPTD